MNRRKWVTSLFAAVAGVKLASAQTKTAQGMKGKPIQLFVEMDVDPAREKEMLSVFHNRFAPEAKKHPGYIDVKVLKLRQMVQGGPQPLKYRFELIMESEELRQKWINSPEHKRLWPQIEATLRNKSDYPVVLYDEV